MFSTKKNWKTGIVAVLIVFGITSLMACSSKTDQGYVHSAKEYLNARDLSAAFIELKNALQENSSNGEARYLLGQINLELGDVVTAKKELRHALEAGWDEAAVRTLLGEALFQQQKYQELLDQIGVKADYPANRRADLLGIRGMAQVGLEQLDEAKKTFETGRSLNEPSSQLAVGEILLQLAQDNPRTAENTLDRALEIHPTNQSLWLLKARFALQSGRHLAARTAYQEVIEQEPPKLTTVKGWQAHLGQARVGILSKEFEQAHEAVKASLKIRPANLEANFLGGIVAFELGDYELADKRLAQVLKATPPHIPSIFLSGATNYALKNYEQAAYFLSKYVAAEPKNLRARKLLGRTYLALGHYGNAGETLRSALLEVNDDAELLALVGVSDLNRGMVKTALGSLEKAVATAPEDTAIRGQLAKAYMSSGDTDKAIQELELIVEQGNTQYRAEYLLVLAYLRQKNFNKAIQSALSLLEKRPDDPAVANLVGGVYIYSGDKKEGRIYFNKALALKPDFVPAAMNIARLEELEGKPDKAQERYEAILKTAPNSITAMMALARLAEQQGQHMEAMSWLEKAREADPKALPPRVLLANYYLRNGKLTRVEEIVKELEDTSPNQAPVLAIKGRLSMAQKRYNEAFSKFNALNKALPRSSEAKYLLAQAQLRLGDVAEAKQTLQRSLELKEDYLPAIELLAEIEVRSKKTEKALELSREIKRLRPDAALGYRIEGDALMQHKRYTAALRAYDEAAARQQTAELAIKRYLATSRLGKTETAQKILKQWLEEHPKDAKVHMVLASAYQAKGQFNEAAGHFEAVLETQANNYVALNNLAWISHEQNSPAEALELAGRAYELKPDDPSVLDTYGWILLQQGQITQGRRLIEKAAEKLPDLAEVRYHLAVAKHKSGEEQAARKELTALLASKKTFLGRDDAEALLGRMK